MAPYKNLKIFNSCSKCSDDKCKRLQQLSHYNFTRSMAVGLTSIYDGEGQNNWFQFYLGISGVMCLSASQYSLSVSDLSVDHTKRPVMTFTRLGPRVTSWCPPGQGEQGVITGSRGEHQHYTGLTCSTVDTSSTNKV